MKRYGLAFTASYIGYVIQAMVINFAPLLFVMFQKEFNLSISKISALIVVNFAAQLSMDILSSIYVDKLGYRKCIIAAHIFATFGVASLSFLPDIMNNHFIGLLISMFFSGLGGGIIEVVVSPVVEALPTKSKSASMSLLHSFYSWGHFFIVILATLYFITIGIENWRILAIIFSLVPFINGILFAICPIESLQKEGEEKVKLKYLLSTRIFFIFLLLMFCGGAAEQAIVQWSSAYAELGLNIDKTFGDIIGTAMFALLMGTSRVIYSICHKKIHLLKFMMLSMILLVASYLLASLSVNPWLSLLGCAMTGFASGIVWPGTLSLTSRYVKASTAMYALLAFTGDIGCTVGPWTTGLITDITGNMQDGFLISTIYPLITVLALIIIWFYRKKVKENEIKK